MAAEPEKNIEHLLHAYSRKRREDANAPLEVHPATRRMLQGEVARQFKDGGANAPGQRRWWQILLLCGPKYAGAVGMFAVLALGIWVVTHDGPQSHRVDNVTSERAQTADAESSRALDELAKRESERLQEADDLALGRSARPEPALDKKVAGEKTGDDAQGESKTQFRDAGNRRAPSATPAVPVIKPSEQLAREKQVILQDQAQTTERIADVIAGGPLVSLDKSVAKDGAFENRQYKETEGRAETPSLAVSPAATQPITARLDFAASKPDNAYYFAYGVSNAPTNVALAVPAQSSLSFGDAFTSAATEWSAISVEPAQNEFVRTRALQPATGVAQQTEERESTTPAMLRNFSVEQSNGRIRIRDADDGSIYDGEVLAVSESNVIADTKAVAGELRQLRKNAEAQSAPITFRASGVNQRFKQVVIINGQLGSEQERGGAMAGKAVAEAAGTALAPTTPTPPQSRATQPPADRPALAGQSAAAAPARTSIVSTTTTASATASNAFLRATTLRARVQIGATNEIDVRAVRQR